ncbi:Macrophage mannose receptor 1 [Triplophysa tibetana]|uniref:Macrophage mannose receptor 1 n=1 Tax=Triplophysa tibetana TaxID=1572043 RepID=A0A5A9PS27_9TELE|nr:Macrophage mannose receptor 1 [Triplophysa tibetana]
MWQQDVGGAVRRAVGGDVAANVGGAVRRAIGGDVGGAVRRAMGGAVGGDVGGDVRRAMGGDVGGAVRADVGEAVRRAVGGDVAADVGRAVRRPLGGAVRRDMGGDVGGAVRRAVGRDVAADVGGAVRRAMAGDVGGAVGADVGRAVGGDVGGAVGADVGGAVSADMGGAVLTESGSFLIHNKDQNKCVNVVNANVVEKAECDVSSDAQRFRWVSSSRIISVSFKLCLGAQDIKNWVKMILLPCKEHSPLQTWECKNETLFGLKDQLLHLNYGNRGESNMMLFNRTGIWSRWQIYGSEDNLCSHAYQALYRREAVRLGFTPGKRHFLNQELVMDGMLILNQCLGKKGVLDFVVIEEHEHIKVAAADTVLDFVVIEEHEHIKVAAADTASFSGVSVKMADLHFPLPFAFVFFRGPALG